MVFSINKLKLKNKEKNDIAKALSMLSQIGILMVVTIFMCFFIGLFIDNKFDTSPIFMIVGIVVGVLTALRNMYVVVMRTWKD
jgi:ATP synthase protein I